MTEFVNSAKGRSAALADLPPISGEVNVALTMPRHAASGGYVARTRRAPESVSGRPAADRLYATKTRSSVGRKNRRLGENDRRGVSGWQRK